MKTLKKNNKGFSLVELIVVILIMAIIAVALAPQVMKWVDESRISADNSNRATIKGAVDAAVADYMSEGEKIDSNLVYYIADGVLAASASDAQAETMITGIDIDDPTDMPDFIAQVLNQQYPGVKQDEEGYFKVDITTTGAVTVTVCDENGVDLFSGED